MNVLDLTASFIALVILEIVLGIDNLVLLSILTEKLPVPERHQARRWGLMLAWVTRLMLLASALALVKLTRPIFSIGLWSFSWRDIFLGGGGMFLIAKATQEIHNEVGEDGPQTNIKSAKIFHKVVMQVALMDIIFSLDSVLTAVGLTSNFSVMALAISFAIYVMIYLSEPISLFIERHPSIKMLALSFLILIGMVLIADSLSFHVPRGYIYFAMGFSLSVESLNLARRSRQRHKKKR